MEQKIKIIDIENELASHLRTPMSAHSCIFRVPTTLRRHNEHLFKPNLVSIGPYHCTKPKLQPMREIKKWYLDCLIERAPTPETSVECFTKSITSNVNQCLECYAEKVELSIDEFVEMMVLDGCFIIEYFRKCANLVPPRPDDPLFKMPWMRKALIIDLLLIENQLPWFVLDCLFNLTNNNNDDNFSLPQLAHNVLYWDTLRFEPIKVDSWMQNKHLLDLQRNIILTGYKDSAMGHFTPTPSVKELLHAGVKFQVGEKKNLLKIEFQNGVITIPPIVVLDNAESFFRNLIAYEQCDRSLNGTISCYAAFLDNLINSSEDLDHLCQNGIVTCFLSTEDVSGFFSRLYMNAYVAHSPFQKIAEDINIYCTSNWQRWRAILSRKYFNNPWSIISLTAAVILLVLTFLQTVFAML